MGIEKFNYVRNILRYPESTDRPLINATDKTKWSLMVFFLECYEQLILRNNPAMDKHPIQRRGVEVLLAALCLKNRDKFRPNELLGLYVDLTVSVYLTIKF